MLSFAEYDQSVLLEGDALLYVWDCGRLIVEVEVVVVIVVAVIV